PPIVGREERPAAKVLGELNTGGGSGRAGSGRRVRQTRGRAAAGDGQQQGATDERAAWTRHPTDGRKIQTSAAPEGTATSCGVPSAERSRFAFRNHENGTRRCLICCPPSFR